MDHTSTSTSNQASDLVQSLEELNSRIVRLSKFLEADILSEEALKNIFERRLPQLQHHAPVNFSLTQEAERRVQNDWEELRGLLILRCEIMTHFVDEFGIEAAKNLAEAAEAALEAHGFEPGVDGLRLFRRT